MSMLSRSSSGAVGCFRSCDTQKISSLPQRIERGAGIIQVHNIRRNGQNGKDLTHCTVELLGRHATQSQAQFRFRTGLAARMRPKEVHFPCSIAQENGNRFVNFCLYLHQGTNLPTGYESKRQPL